MSSTVLESRIFASMFSTEEMREVFSEKAWVQKWLDTEAALAQAQGELGVIPKEKADIINKYAKADLLDIDSIGEYIKSSITIVPCCRTARANSCTGALRARTSTTRASFSCSAMPTRSSCAT